MKSLIEWVQGTVGLSPEMQVKIFTSFIIVLVLWLLHFLIIRIVWRRTEDVRIRYSWQKTFGYIAVILGIFLVGRLWFKGFQSIAT